MTPRPERQQANRGGRQQSVRRAARQGKRRFEEKVASRLARGLRGGEFGSEGSKHLVEPGDVGRRIDDPETTRHPGHLRDVLVATVGIERTLAVAVVGGEETVDLGGVHPEQQTWIASGVLASVRSGALHALVDPVHHGDGLLGLIGGTEGGGGKEVGGPLQPSPWVGSVVAVLGHPGHGEGVDRLDQQGAEPTDEHRGVRVHPHHR